MDKYQFSETQLAFMESSRIPFAVYQFIDKRVVTLALSAGFLDLFGYEHDEGYRLMDTDMYHDTHPEDVSRIASAAYRFATEGGTYNVVYRTKCAHGYKVVHASGEHVYLDDGVRLAIVWYTDEDVTISGADEFESELNQAINKAIHEEALFQQTYYDQLTGLANMAHFINLADAGWKHLRDVDERPALVFFNLSGMKMFNHKYGFAEGDKLIKAMAKVLVGFYGSENCGRIGKDHFAALTTDGNLEETLREVLDACEIMNDGLTLPVHAGIYLDQADEPLDISIACDKARYACQLNRDTYASRYSYFDEEILKNAERRQYIIDNLDRAIDEGWIKVYYQAIVRSANGLVCDEEALARWDDPTRGLLSPAEFIPTLEEAKLIYKLDLYMVEQVIGKMKEQAAAGLYVVPQSVNLSRTDFDSVDIVEEVRQRVDDAGIPRDKLTVEITESAIASDFEFMQKQVDRLRELGFKVWMDDFGSGYSSLDLLKDMHFDLVKLDMRFLEDFDRGEEGKIIITELVRLSMSLGIDTLAEGVETREEAAFLKEIGCGRLQGYYFTKPVPLETIVERNQKGTQIGFENPDEAEYYVSLSRINLYDMGVIVREEEPSLKKYFDTLPMAILEIGTGDPRIIRSNKSYRIFVERAFGIPLTNEDVFLHLQKDGAGSQFLAGIRQCCKSGKAVVLDEETDQGQIIHAILKRVAVNPVKETAAVFVGVLAITNSEDRSTAVTYASVAEALSSNYYDLYYVNLDTDRFIQYSSNGADEGLSEERHGSDFFGTSQRDAQIHLHEADRATFAKAFNKENVLAMIDEEGAFIISYRLIVDGKPRHMLMKGMRMGDDAKNYLVIGVSDVDSEMKQREELERMRSEQVAYARIIALVDEYICMYTVNPATGHYLEYSSTGDYEGLGIAKEGDDFFAESQRESMRTIHEDDLETLAARFNKETVLGEIEQNGSFIMRYRLLIDGEPVHVMLKAVLVQEKDGPCLVVGVRRE